MSAKCRNSKPPSVLSLSKSLAPFRKVHRKRERRKNIFDLNTFGNLGIQTSIVMLRPLIRSATEQ
jgi:hypothetical protein